MVCCIMALQAGEEKGTVEDHVRILVHRKIKDALQILKNKNKR